MTALAPVLVALACAGHARGLAQGVVVIDDDPAAADLDVTVDLVFARVDADGLPPDPVDDRATDTPDIAGGAGGAGGARCVAAPPAWRDVGGDGPDDAVDGRAVVIAARCPRDAPVVVDVAGLAALGGDMRLLLHVAADDERDVVLTPARTAVVARRAPDRGGLGAAGAASFVLVVVAVVGGVFGASRRRSAVSGGR